MTFDYEQMLTNRANGTQGKFAMLADGREYLIVKSSAIARGLFDIHEATANEAAANVSRFSCAPEMEAEIIRLRAVLKEVALLSGDPYARTKATAALKGESE